MNLQEALRKAQTALAERVQKSEKLCAFKFDPVALQAECEGCWAISAGSEDMLSADYVPAALFFYVDKQEGHIWGTGEINDYFYQAVPSIVSGPPLR